MWEIYAYQNADSLFGVFNAAAAIHASGDYAAAVAAVAFCGFVAALIAYAFAPEKLQGWKWLGTVVLVFSVLIVPKVTVGIVDKTGGSAVKVVDNVPFGVALLGSLTSTIGHTLTGLFETAFQVIPGIGALPAELAYQQNGLMFGNRLIRETGNVVFQDPAFRTDLINFIHNCTTYDLIDGTLDPAAFSTSDDVWPLMASPNPARFSTLTSTGGSVGVDTCPNVYQSLNGRLPAQITRIEGRLALQLNPTLPGAAAAAAIAGQIQQAYLKNSIATAAATAADLIRQNAMLNAIDDTSKIVGQKVNDPAAMVLAVGRAQAVAQQNATWLNYGKVAEQALPVFRNVVEAVTYAMFPLFLLLLLLTSGRETMIAFKGYAAVLIWIQLWPPLYAILNYMASIYAAYDLAAAADLGTGAKALALQTASTIYSRAISGEAVVGYLAMSIPFIAWAALKRMENFGTALVGGLSGLQAMISGGTSASAVGNISMGNVGMDQMHLAPNRTSAFMHSWQNDLSGNTFSSNVLTGRTAVSLLRNQGFASRMVSMRVSEQDVVQASRQADAARGEAISANTERSAALTETFTRGLAKLRSLRSSSGTVSSSFEQIGETLNRLDQISKNVADSTGLTQSQVAQIAFGAAGHLGINTPVAGAELQARAGKNYMSGLSAAQQKVLNSLTQEQIAEFKQFGDRVSRDSSLINSFAKDSREAQDMSSRLASVMSRAERPMPLSPKERPLQSVSHWPGTAENPFPLISPRTRTTWRCSCATPSSMAATAPRRSPCLRQNSLAKASGQTGCFPMARLYPLPSTTCASCTTGMPRTRLCRPISRPRINSTARQLRALTDPRRALTRTRARLRCETTYRLRARPSGMKPLRPDPPLTERQRSSTPQMAPWPPRNPCSSNRASR
ncbi:conjugal transfer protein TraG N-terminal domain-containing protein [Aromatoleum aromaticum]|uniref:Similar to plasmid-like sex pilus assembly and mating pair stabilization protein TraG n=1 Tax=Aromatoleum aromaticum (strain DSM 19018 / LMG 30748 / EbN1) TaxID=76114 RepID=Q5NYE9_AROAE|nr:conjugal transfer protein TraG N-terminal domain-containing protein [Aromatoleum aromaticum]CAI09915.1 similar to plasmid-like sex pilus assembly and mating pair stabilization protein TraG [Aromatoleum aromaticum EbN1]